MTTAMTRRRYRLHQKIKHDFKYDPRKKTVYVNFDIQELPAAILELRERHRYNVQLSIY